MWFLFYQGTSSMRKIALFIAMLLLPCVSFAGLLSSNSSTTPVSKEYKQQLMGSPVYIEIFKEERTLDLYVKMGETYQLLDSYRICNYSGGLGPKQRQGDFKSPEGFYNVTAASSNLTAASIKPLISASRTPTIAPMVMKVNT
jgi:murein L,D-transpeptidase YafK